MKANDANYQMLFDFQLHVGVETEMTLSAWRGMVWHGVAWRGVARQVTVETKWHLVPSQPFHLQ